MQEGQVILLTRSPVRVGRRKDLAVARSERSHKKAALIAGLVIATSVIVVVTALVYIRSSRTRETITLLKQLGAACEMYNRNWALFPCSSSYGEIETVSSKATDPPSGCMVWCPGQPPVPWPMRDAWGHVFRYRDASEDETLFMLWSPGPNGVDGDSDDLVLSAPLGNVEN